MQIQGLSLNTISGTRNFKSTKCVSNVNKLTYENDSFVKQNSQISFKGRQKEDNLGDSIASIGLVGGSLLLSIAAGIALTQNEDLNEIFADNDGYSINLDDSSVISDKVVADADDGIFKVEGTGIDINPDRFSGEDDVFDPTRGVYKTADGSIDIDLLNNKYIDSQNGIYVDPEHKISTLVDSNGEYRHFKIPNVIFRGSSMSGSNYGADVINPYDGLEGMKDGFVKDFVATIKTSPLFEKFFLKEQLVEADDLFGRKTIEQTDEDGNKYVSTIPENLPSSISRLGSGSELVASSTEELNDSNFSSYLKDRLSMSAFIESTRPSANNADSENQDSLSDYDPSSFVIDPFTADLDKTGIPDYIELGLTPEEAIKDGNVNHIPDFLEEIDDDEDGTPDIFEDDDNDGIPNIFEDDDGDGIPNYLDSDANGNGIPDYLEN